MTFRQLLLRNLTFYWRTNLAVVCGVIAATAVITGALIVGDSVRDSLVEMSNARLGEIDDAVLGGRFFREALAGNFEQAEVKASANQPANQEPMAVAPVLILQGTLEFSKEQNALSRAGQINVYGVDQRMWKMVEHADISRPESGEIVLNQRVAEQLGVSTGETISLIIEIPSSIPRDALLGERNQLVTELSLKVTGIAEDQLGLARLGMNPTQQLPANAYVSLSDLQSQMGLAAVARSRRNPVAKPARVNSLFISNPPQMKTDVAQHLTATLKASLTLADLGLRIVENEKHGYISFESEQMFLESAISQPALQAAQTLGVTASPVLVYLANEISSAKSPEHYSMYSIVAGIEPTQESPFGPFEFIGDHRPLTGDGVYLNEWVAEDLQVAVGDRVQLKYYVVGDRGELPEAKREFTVAGIVKLTGPAADRGYTPDVPGVTDAESYADWREPFPLKRDRITDRDDDYWEEYRTTPKLFLSLQKAQELWQSRYGKLTTIRLAPGKGQSLTNLTSQFEKQFLSQIEMPLLGLNVQPVRKIGLKAAQGTTDFTGLFIGFSFFLILSAALLVGLLFRLGVERRLREIGLLSAVGLSPASIRTMLFLEGGLLVGIGGLLGLAAAVGYAAVMIHGLKTWWYGAIGTKFLFLSVHPLSLLIGLLIAVFVALIAIWWAQRQATQQSTRSLLHGETGPSKILRRPWISRTLAAVCLAGSLLLLILTLTGIIPDVEAFSGFSWRVVMFFLVGMGLLTGSLAAFAVAMASRRTFQLRGSGMIAEARLGFRNAARNRSRSVLTASLIASATFVIVAVAAGQMNPIGDAPRKASGNGGFTLVAQTNVPILYDLNSEEGRSKLGFNVLDQSQMVQLNEATVFPFRMKPGENASCLNLYQTQLPTVLGVPDDVLNQLIEEDRFLFADTHAKHPWSLLRKKLPEGRIPVLGDMNTLMYSLHKGIGTTINVPSDADPQHTLEVAGMFANSVFQGVLVMSESNFLKLFPDQAGFQYFLIEVDPQHAGDVSELLESQLGDYGFDADRVSQRLADFLSVQNTYLSTFQTLGGLGLLLGTIGLATVMLRNVLERVGEFALLRAVGFQKGQVARLVIWENALLLGSGLVCGTASALLAMSPQLNTTAANVPWTSLISLLLAVFIVGMLSAIIAVAAAVRTPILATLRGE